MDFKGFYLLAFVAVIPTLSSCKQMSSSTHEEAMMLALSPVPIREGVPFYQAVPFPQGALAAGKSYKMLLNHSSKASTPIKAHLKPSALWPDGSIRWLAVEGILPEGLVALPSTPIKGIVQADPGPPPVPSTARDVTLSMDETGAKISFHSAAEGHLFDLVPSASCIAVNQPKARPTPEQQASADYVDGIAQYAWAMPLAELSTEPSLQRLSPKVENVIIEEENALYTLWKAIGSAGDNAPGSQLEWVLRAKVYHQLSLIRTSMTWVHRWQPDRYALTSAEWTLEHRRPFTRFASLCGEQSGKRLGIASEVTGRSVMETPGVPAHWEESPALNHNGLVAHHEKGAIAVGVPNFTRLGPNRLSGAEGKIVLAAWDGDSGLGLDLRRSGGDKDFGMDPVDLKENGAGMARTLDAGICWNADPAAAAEIARGEAARDWLWFTTPEELARTHALGPFRLEALVANKNAFNGVHANLLFLARSRDHWRWNGYANFGDFRTNFALGDAPDRGLNAGRWALFGRYGWRNASGSLNYSFLSSGLFFNDRELALAGLDHALHVVDVDTRHPSLFVERKYPEGGMHRRNRDHWSGSLQVQYSPTHGIYFAQWLSGSPRIAEVLASTREYVKEAPQTGSAFAAQAWVLRYMETHDPADLVLASQLLQGSADWWREHSRRKLEGLSALYTDNFRRTSDGIQTLVRFHEATGDPAYLQAILGHVIAHPAEPEANTFHEQFGAAYLLEHGITPNQIGEPYLRALASSAKKFLPGPLPDARTLDYAALQDLVTRQLPPVGNPVYRESGSIAGRSAYSFLGLTWFGDATPFEQ